VTDYSPTPVVIGPFLIIALKYIAFRMPHNSSHGIAVADLKPDSSKRVPQPIEAKTLPLDRQHIK
jgi:hypothetical protein